jgi:small GTP-binding protein
MNESSQKKVIVIGDGAVGKTCFVSKVTENKFIQNYLPTLGVEYGVKVVRRENHDVKLCLWDIAGQDRFRGLMPQFYRNAAVAIVMCDVTQPISLQSAKVWKKQVDDNVLQPNGQPIPAVLLINKFDLPKQMQQISVEDIQNVARECSFLRQFQISVKDSTNILEALEYVAELAERYEDDERTYQDTAGLSLPTMYSEHRKKHVSCCGST